MDRKLARKNLRTAFIACAIMLFMFAMTWIAALIYVQ
jgi:4-amino-4-deoxy-L-arabinose transferase-like glycosyltransferase